MEENTADVQVKLFANKTSFLTMPFFNLFYTKDRYLYNAWKNSLFHIFIFWYIRETQIINNDGKFYDINKQPTPCRGRKWHKIVLLNAWFICFLLLSLW